MTAPPELTEKLLIEAGGWQAMKAARSLHAAGRVTEAIWQAPEATGRVRDGETEFRAGLRIVTRRDVTNLCTCRISRHQGMICAHSLAVALASLQPAHAPRPPSSSAEVMAPAGLQGHAVVSGVSLSLETGIAAEVAIVFPANLANSFERNSITVVPEVLLPERIPLGALRAGQSYHFSPPDLRLVEHLISEAGGLLPGALTLSTARFADLLRQLVGHPRVTLGRGPAVSVKSDSERLVLRATYAGDGDLQMKLEVPPNVRVVSSGAHAWLFTEPAAFEPFASGLPPAYRALLTQEVTIPAAGVANFMEREAAVLRQFFELRLPGLSKVDPVESEAATFTLKLEGSLKHLEAELEAHTSKQAVTVTSPGYQPRTAAEAVAIERLSCCGFQPSPRDPWVLKGEPAILQFFARDLPRLENEWKVVIGTRFAHVTSDLERVQPVISIRGTGENWFEAGIEFSTGGTDRIAASEIRRLLQSGQKSLTLRNRKRLVLHDGLLEEFDEVLLDCNPEQRQPGLYRFSRRDADYVRSLEESAGARLQQPKNGSGLSSVSAFEPVPLGAWDSVLRSYQKEGVYWLNTLAENSFGGILADEMGLGKTVQTLAFLSRLDGCSLVICPSSLVINWHREAERFAPELRAQPVHGSERWDAAERLRDARVLITSYALLRRDLSKYRNRDFACIVLDEAQHIKNPQSQSAQAVFTLRAPRRFALTGTPIENSVRDVWSIMNFLMPRYLGPQEDFKDRYETPIAIAPGGPEHRRLVRRLKPFILRRTKKEVATELPEKIEQVLLCELNDRQRSVYGEVLSHARRVVSGFDASTNSGQARMAALTILLRLRQACLDLRLLGLDSEATPEASAKMELLRELLDEALRDGHRVLVFSQFSSMLRLIQEQLGADSIDCCYLDGQTRDRQAVVDRFQNGGPPVFLISLKAGGVGLNLTAADTVIHFDPWWNPAVEAQATDRAHRIGQTRVVTAYKLIARGTVEEKILALQNRKRTVSNLTVESDEPLMGGLSDTELQDVLS